MEPCGHLAALPAREPEPRDTTCPECRAAGTHPVQLRLCLSCGHVGCCDSSSGRHATRHHEASGHPVMRSFEPGQGWRWCYVDARLV